MDDLGGIYHHGHFIGVCLWVFPVRDLIVLCGDFVCYARALGRIGSVHMKREEYALAVKFFDKSLAEFRNQDIIKKKKEVMDRGGQVKVCCINNNSLLG